MSEHEFHVHGPHDHAIDHAVESAHGASAMVNQIAMFTAIIATIAAIFSYMGGATQANAGLYKNNAALKKAEASNQWSYYQAKSTKQALAELAMNLSPEVSKSMYQSKIDRYEKEKAEIKTGAEKLEVEVTEWNGQSDEQMHQHHRWAQSTTVLQVSIALAAIALLTRKKWLKYGMLGVGGLGVVIGCLAAFHV